MIFMRFNSLIAKDVSHNHDIRVMIFSYFLRYVKILNKQLSEK